MTIVGDKMLERGKTLIQALEENGFEPRSYSGRNMYGHKCVSVHANKDNGVTLWDLAQVLALAMDSIGEPQSDQLGLGYVYYWPSATWPE